MLSVHVAFNVSILTYGSCMQCVQIDQCNVCSLMHVLYNMSSCITLIHHSDFMFFGYVCSVYTGTGTVYVCIHVMCGVAQCLLCWQWCFLLAHVGMGSH